MSEPLRYFLRGTLGTTVGTLIPQNLDVFVRFDHLLKPVTKLAICDPRKNAFHEGRQPE
jgi:hypothetical protein